MEHEIYLRCHTRILDEDVRSPNTRRNLSPLRYVLVLDTETTTDALLNLNVAPESTEWNLLNFLWHLQSPQSHSET